MMLPDWLDWGQLPPWLLGVLMGSFGTHLRAIAVEGRSEARLARKEVREVADELHGETTAEAPEEPTTADPKSDGRPGRIGRGIALAVVVFAAGLSAIIAGVNNTKANHKYDEVIAAQAALDKDQADFKAQADCQQRFLEAQSIALKARSNFAEEQARVQLRAVNAAIHVWREFLHLTGPDAQQQGVDLVNGYISALEDQRTAILDQLRIRERSPYPEQSSIEACATIEAGDPQPSVTAPGQAE